MRKNEDFFSYIYYYWSETYRCLEYFVILRFVILKFHCILTVFISLHFAFSNIFSVLHKTKEQDADSDSDNDTVGGIFRLKTKNDSRRLGTMYERDCTLEQASTSVKDWSQPEVLQSIRDCFVTGKWKDSEDAEALLQHDDQCMRSI